MSKNNKKNKRPSAVKVFLIIFVVLLIVFTGGRFVIEKYGLFGLVGGDVTEDVTALAGGDSAFSEEFSTSKRVNVLLLGNSSLDLTDTMMLLSFDTELKRVDVISVPRDTYYERSGYDGAAWQKINSVFKSEGYEGVAAAVSNVLGGVPVHSYARIADAGVAKVVDAMGGVDIYVPMDMNYTDVENDLYIDLQEGQQTLNGDQAIQYLRFRSGYNTGDLGRVNAQQEFMRQAFKQSIGFGFPKVVTTVIDEVETGLSTALAVRLGSKAVGMNAEDIETWTIPGDYGTMDGLSFFLHDPEGTVELMREIYSITKE